jgi:hypothetical protein
MIGRYNNIEEQENRTEFNKHNGIEQNRNNRRIIIIGATEYARIK